MLNNHNMVYPCPFSKGYGVPRQQAWLLLNLFFLYRFVIASLFVILFFTYMGPTLLGQHDPKLYISSSLCYLILSCISGFCVFFRFPDYTTQAQLLIFTDIIFITLLMHASGGVVSGIGILLTVTTSAGGLLIGGKCAMLFAAIASIAILSEQIYSTQSQTFDSAWSYAGMLGASFFTIALLSYTLAKRTEQTERIASQRERKITQLEELNKYIIQHLQSGIVITDKDRQILLMNEAALGLFNLQTPLRELKQISTQLNESFQNWRLDSSKDFMVLKLPNHCTLHIHFNPLPTGNEILYMLTVEDIVRYNQRQQQSKLASLGQLSASIAHEIRNPLGAISHAGQLLSESPDLQQEDKRLTDIIQTHSKRVNQIIEDILQLSKKRISKREKINIAKWLRNYLQKFVQENGLDENQFSMTTGGENTLVVMDPNHLMQIMDNLCLNALKYGANGSGQVIIKTSFSKQPCIEVIDHGPGVHPDHINQLFEPFFTTSATGTGLGLYISRELAELNQAKLDYSLTQTHGSCFRLCLPDAKATMIEI